MSQRLKSYLLNLYRDGVVELASEPVFLFRLFLVLKPDTPVDQVMFDLTLAGGIVCSVAMPVLAKKLRYCKKKKKKYSNIIKTSIEDNRTWLVGT